MDFFGPCALREVELDEAQRLCDNKANVGKEASSLEVSFHKADVAADAERDSPKTTTTSSQPPPKSQTESGDAIGISSLRTSRAPSERKEEDAIVIEERRRRAAGGDGYTTHRYIRGRMLGKGGFAKVYHCTSMDTGKNYAVKIVPKANLVKARARQKVRKTGGQHEGRADSERTSWLTYLSLYSCKRRSRFIVRSSTRTFASTSTSLKTAITATSCSNYVTAKV
jgi:hypothetical protein